MICELARYSSGAESCAATATHRVDTQPAGDTATRITTRSSYELCRAHAVGAIERQHRSPAVPGEVVTVTPGL